MPPVSQQNKHSRKVILPATRRAVNFYNRAAMKAGHPVSSFMVPAGSPPIPTGVIDWTLSGKILMPMDGNDTYGDCQVAAAEHWDNCATGCAAPPQSVFVDATTDAWYLALSGGDNGLSNGQIIAGWKNGLPGTPAAGIADALSLDSTNPAAVRSAMYLYGPVCWQFSCPDSWYNSFTTAGGVVWGAPSVPDPNNGHAIVWPAINAAGQYRGETWGSYVWIVPGCVSLVDPTAFAVFSRRWFNPAGYAPNGLHISVLAPLWVTSGGSSVVTSLVPLYPPVGAPPTPTPTPGKTSVLTLSGLDAAGQYALVPVAAVNALVAVRDNLSTLLDALGAAVPEKKGGAG